MSLSDVSKDGFGAGCSGGIIAESGFNGAPSTAYSAVSAVLTAASVSFLLSGLLLMSLVSKEGFGGGLGGFMIPVSLDLLLGAWSEALLPASDSLSPGTALALVLELLSGPPLWLDVAFVAS